MWKLVIYASEFSFCNQINVLSLVRDIKFFKCMPNLLCIYAVNALLRKSWLIPWSLRIWIVCLFSTYCSLIYGKWFVRYYLLCLLIILMHFKIKMHWTLFLGQTKYRFYCDLMFLHLRYDTGQNSDWLPLLNKSTPLRWIFQHCRHCTFEAVLIELHELWKLSCSSMTDPTVLLISK